MPKRGECHDAIEQDERNPGDPPLDVVKALMRSIPDDTYADPAAYHARVR